MTEKFHPGGDIFDPDFWADRLQNAVDQNKSPHFSIYECSDDKWERIEARHIKELHNIIRDRESILDIGCGWGRLFGLLSETWEADYLGIDICSEFLAIAEWDYPDRKFILDDMAVTEKTYLNYGEKYDWAIMISIRPMVVRDKGQDVWDRMEANIRRSAENLLFLEYTNNRGMIE